MNQDRKQIVFAGGLRGTLVRPTPDAQGYVEVAFDDGRRVLLRADQLQSRPDGALVAAGDAGAGAGSTAAGAGSTAERAGSTAAAPASAVQTGQGRQDEQTVIPVVQEELAIGERVHEAGRVVVQVTPHTRTERVDVPVTVEQAEIERVPMDRFVDQPEGPRQEGDAIVIPVYEEVVTVVRRLRLKEEVRVTRKRTRHTEPRDVELRREEVRVVRTDPDARPNPPAGSAAGDKPRNG